MLDTVWVCGQYRDGTKAGVIWELQGVFSTKEKAIAVCRYENYFVMPVKIDHIYPHETMSEPIEGSFYPLLQDLPE